MSAKDYAYIFEGDGRQMVEPQPEWQMPGYPIPIRRQLARTLGQRFEENGVSNHSDLGHTLWVAIAWAQYKEFGTALYAEPGGYALRKVS